MELVIAVAIGLNPYIATLFPAALVVFTGRLPEAGWLGSVPDAVWYATIVLFGLALPIDLMCCKFARIAPYTRRASEFVAPAAAAIFVAVVTRSELPLAVVA